MSESNEDAQEESTNITADPIAEEQAFREMYLQTTGAKSTKSCGHGCMWTHSNKRILQDKLEDQAKEIHRLKEMMVQKDAENEAESKSLQKNLDRS